MFTEPPSRLTTSLQYLLVTAGVPAWIAACQFVPVLRTMPGVVVLVAFVTTAFTLHLGPATLAVIIGTLGHEIIRGPAPALVHLQRVLVVASVGVVIVVLAYSRTAMQVAALRFRTLFDEHPLPMWVFDEETMAFLSVNEAARRTYGYSAAEFSHMTLRDIRPPEGLPVLEARPWKDSGNTIELVTQHLTKSGQRLDVQIRAQEIKFQGYRARLALIENITGQRALEAQLRQSQKMEAIGQLAGGIAHDFNNLLTAIRGYATMVYESLPEDDARREDVAEIERAGERATALTRQLLAFSRKQILQERVISLNNVVEDLAPMLARLVGENIRVRTVTRAAGLVKADASQLDQVLMNLVVNARDAVGESGEITIETDDVVLDDFYAQSHPTAAAGPHVLMAVSDNGTGMSAEVQTRAFEPFFTTKGPGQNTGLGLAMVYGIVKQSGGHLYIYSEPGRGTTVKVYLPRTDDVPEASVEPSRPQPPRTSVRASILLVEDEEAVRSLLAKVLGRAGYTVHQCATPSEAQALLADGAIRFDLLITDVVLTEGSGREVAEAVRAAQPHVRVLYISGYTDDAVIRRGILTEDMAFLQKPFAANTLLERVAALLAQPR